MSARSGPPAPRRRGDDGGASEPVGIFLDPIADYPGAAEMARAFVGTEKARLPEDHREVARGRGQPGCGAGAAGHLAAAEAHLARAVALDEAHRPGSADLATSYDLHGGVLLDQARAGGRRCCRRPRGGISRRWRCGGGCSGAAVTRWRSAEHPGHGAGRAGARGGGGAALRSIASHPARGAAAGGRAAGLWLAEHRGDVAPVRRGGSGGAAVARGAGPAAGRSCRAAAHPEVAGRRRVGWSPACWSGRGGRGRRHCARRRRGGCVTAMGSTSPSSRRWRASSPTPGRLTGQLRAKLGAEPGAR